jgi:outer membrane protein assembly factor BamB
MKTVFTLAIISAGCAANASAQGRPVDWTSFGGDAQRTGWEKSDSRITRENVKDFQLVLKRKLEGPAKGPRSLTPPVVIGTLISYKGFKELAFVAGASGQIWSIDADTDRMFWQKRLDTAPAKANAKPGCSGVTVMPSLSAPMGFGAAARAARTPRPGSKPAAVGPTGFGAARPIYTVSGDGKLHRLNTSTGDDQLPPVDFLPPGSKASTLTVFDNVVYTTTSSECGGSQDGVWAIDLSVETPIVASFPLKGGDAQGPGGLALGTDGTVYVQTGSGPFDPATNKWSNSLLALSPVDLKLKHYFTVPEKSGAKAVNGLNNTTPVVFAYKGRDLVVSAGRDGSLYLLDSQSLGGEDNKSPLFRTEPLSASDRGIFGGISSWQDEEGSRWVVAPVWGPLNKSFKAPDTDPPTNGALVAFRLEEHDGKPMLNLAWVSRDMSSPVPPVITSGMVFALSAGDYTKDERLKGSTNAVMYALDAKTGKEIYSTGKQVTSPANLTGMTVANGRVYFTATDNTLYAFGVFLER